MDQYTPKSPRSWARPPVNDAEPRPVDDEIVLDQEAPAAIDLRALWATVYRNRFPMLAILALALLVGVASILLMPRVYQAKASVQIDQQTAKVLGTEDTEPLVSGMDADRFLQTQVDVMESRAMAKRVADGLALATNDDFLKSMGAKLRASDGPTARSDMVLDLLQRNLTIDLKRNSRVVGIYFDSRDPVLAARIANTYSTDFIAANIQRKFSTSQYSRDFLANQLALSKTKLEASERALIGYSRAAGLIDASSGARTPGEAEGPRSLITANLVSLNEAYAQAKAQRLQAQQRWEQANGAALVSLPEVLANDAMQRLLQRRAELTADLNQMRQHLKPDHPTVLQAAAQLSELDTQINGLAGSIRTSLRNQFETARRQEAAIGQQVEVLKGSTLAEQDRGVQYNILKREVDTNRQLFESMLQRFKEVSAEAGVATNNVSVVDIAEPPRKPASPKPLVNLAAALAAGVVLAFAFAFGRERFDDAIRDPRDVEMKLRLPLLGVVPEDQSGDPIVDLDDPKSFISESYHAIRTAIELSTNQGLPPSILVTSSKQGEGKSTTSVALAREFANLGRRTLLIDADLRKPSLHRIMRIPQGEHGLSSVLARMSAPEAAIATTPIPNLSFMPTGPLPPNPASLFAGAALDSLLETLSSSYDLVVLDGPPVLALADASDLSAAAHATVFVVEAISAHFGQARASVERLHRTRGNLLGCVVTKYNSRKLGYGNAASYYRYDYGDAPTATRR